MIKHSEGESIDHLLVQVCRLHRARAHALLEEIGLYRGQPPMLSGLWDEEGRTHSELAELLHVRPATITKMIQRMERAGFVRRRPDPDDERVSRVYLTEAGRSVREDVHEIWRMLEEETSVGFNTEESLVLRRFLMRIRDNLARVSDSESPI